MTSRKSYFKYFLLFIAFVFIAVGIMRDEYIQVLKKAINICLECIGIG